MSRRSRMERMRASVRREVTSDGHDDEQGVVAADETPEPPASAYVIEVPPGVERAASWSWRVLVIAAATYVLYRVVVFFAEITVPVAIAVLLTALAVPAVDGLHRIGVPRAIAGILVVIFGIALVGGGLTIVGNSVADQVDDLRVSVSEGIGQIETWLQDGPLGLSDDQLAGYIDRAQNALAANGGGDGEVVERAAEVGSVATAALTGLFIALFSWFFFMYDGARIWRWFVSLFPRRSRDAVDSSGRVAWVSLTAFVRATVLVALVDAIGIALAAYLLGVPLVLAIGLLVFIGAFVPVIGALLSGFVAVLVALVSQGIWVALFMLIAVVVVQQIEAHVLQPFLMGRLVAIHPLAIILAIAAGITVAGIIGALVAVPMVACLNAVVRHLAERYDPGPVGPAPVRR